MNIAVNTRFLLKDQLEGYGYFTKELLERIVKKHPADQFFFFFDRPFAEEFVFASNVHPVIISPPARLPVLWKFWFDIKLPLALKKINASVFISPDGYCSLTTRIPQCIVVHDLGFLHHPEAYKKSHVSFFKKNTPRFLRKAKSIVTVSQFSKNDIVKHYKIQPGKIDVVYNGVKEIFHPLTIQEKQTTKKKYTEGKEYFIYLGAIQPRKNLIRLLKAFSIFKKRLQSNMKLVLVGRMKWKHDEFYHLLQTYKYRKDVLLTGYLPEEELSALLGSTFALVYPSLFEGFGVPVAEAMKCNIPVLTSQKTSMEEIAGDAALYFNPNDHTDIADKMMMIYKDENLQKQLIEKGRQISGTYNWESAAELFWQTVLKTLDA